MGKVSRLYPPNEGSLGMGKQVWVSSNAAGAVAEGDPHACGL